MKYHTIHLTSSKQIHSTNILALSLVEQAASHLAFLTSSKQEIPLPLVERAPHPLLISRAPCRVLARCGQAINYLALLFILWRLRTLPDADKQVNLLAFLFLLWRLRTLLS